MLRTGALLVKRPKTKLFLAKLAKTYATEANLPNQADVVVIGGGIAGCSVLYQLSKRGIKAVLLEKSKLTCGTTWHTAGLCWNLRPSEVDVHMLKSTIRILNTLEQESGMDSGFTKTGGLFIANSDKRIDEYKRLHTFGHYFGIESHILSPTETAKLCPIIDPKKIKVALWSPTDGMADPSSYCAALTKSAKNRGAEIFEECPVTNLLTEEGRVLRKIIGVETPFGPIKTSCVVNAAGIWSKEITQMVNEDLPICAMKHAYIVTDKVPDAREIPMIRDHDRNVYIRSQGESLLMGGYENNPEILKETPSDFSFGLYDLDMSIFEVHMNNSIDFCPVFGKVGVKSTICGPESFTPDHKPLLGEDPKIVGLYHSCGYNSFGISLSGGCAEQLAIWISQGRPEVPMFTYDIRRFTEVLRKDRAWIKETSHESYTKNYNIVFPHDQRLAGRNHKIDPFHEALVASGAVMEQSQGWERPGYFIKERTAPVRGYDWYGNYGHVKNVDKRYEKELDGDYSFGLSKHHDLIGEEALATRNNVTLFDLSCFTKMYLTGPDASEVADWLFTNNVDRDAGRVVFACSLNSKGGIETDVTVTILEEGVGTLVGPILKGKGYYVVTDGAAGYHTITHFRKHIFKKDFKSIITNITDKLGILAIQGPKSGELLQSITETPITNENFPVGMSHIIKINGHVCRAMRISFVGELGYEIHIPYASCVPVYNKIIKAGRGFDLKHAGFRALGSLSLEKGYHMWNEDLRIDDNPVEANLAHICRKDGQYIGKHHVEKMKQSGVKKQRVFFTMENRIALFGLETIWRDDSIVGYLRRGGYGYALDCTIGNGYIHHPKGQILNDEFLMNGNYQIEVMNKKYPATMYLKSPFDPTNQRIMGKYEHEFEEQHHFED